MTEQLPDSPYQGLEPFTENDRAYFFGREQDQQTIGANLITAQLTVLYGASGVGKTSVLMAGVIPFVRSQPDVAVVLYRNWQVPNAFAALKASIMEATGAKGIDAELPLDRFLEQVGRQTRQTVAVIFDQFEEYLLYNPADTARGRSFDAEFARAVNREDIDANFLISIREDALARLDRFQPYIPDVLGNYLRLDHLDVAGAQRAVEKPLAYYNEVAARRGEPERFMDVEPVLVDKLVNQVRIGCVTAGAQTGKGVVSDSARVETPFLQMVLMKVWDAERAAKSGIMRAATLDRLGGAQEIVRDHVDSFMATLPAAEREASSCIFDRLVTPSGSKIAYNAADLREFAGEQGASIPPLLERLSDRNVRILRAVAPAGDSVEIRYEIFHDVLSSALLAWRARYLREKEGEKERRRRGWISAGVMLLVALVFAAAWYIERRSDRQEALRTRQAERLQASQISEATSRLRIGVETRDLGELQEARRLYHLAGAKSAERVTLVTIGDARVELAQGGDDAFKKLNYAAATQAYDNALKLADNDEQRREITAKRLIALAAAREAESDASGAAQAYHEAANTLAVNGDAAGQVEVLTKSAIALQNAGNLDAAEADWNAALAANQKLPKPDPDSEGKILSGLTTIDKQRKIARQTITLPDNPTPGPERLCTFKDLNGTWRQLDSTRGAFIWRLAIHEAPAPKISVGRRLISLHVDRADGGASGDFFLDDSGKVFVGSLQWVNGDALKDVRFSLPTGDCNRIDTNQGWSFARTSFRMAPTAE